VKSSSQNNARKRPVNLTLSEDLVEQAKSTTDNLSAVVERLLSDYVSNERRQRLAHEERVAETVATWNKFSSGKDSFSDEYSTL
jgi:post-segregation antitoxin (ccd killing protein)